MNGTLESSKLPTGKTCVDCFNVNQCSTLLSGSRGFTPTDLCYFAPSKFNVRWGWTLNDEDLAVIRAYKRNR